MFGVLSLSIYAILFSALYLYLLFVHDGNVIGQLQEGSVVADGSARLRKGIRWSSEEAMSTQGYFPKLRQDGGRCYALDLPGCFVIKRVEYWLRTPTVEQINPKCNRMGCEAPFAFNFSSLGGIPFKQEPSGELAAASKSCPSSSSKPLRFTVIVNSDEPRRLWYKQILLRVAFEAKHPLPRLRRTNNVTVILPLLDHKCQAQFIFSVTKN